MVSESITEGWETFKRYPWLILGALLIVSLVQGAASGPSYIMTENGEPTTASSLWSMVAGFATFPISIGASYLLLRLVRNEPDAGIETLFTGYRHYLSLLGMYIMMFIIVGFGFILLIVPGIIAALGLMQAPYLILDKGLDAVDAMKGSWEMMKGYKMDAFLLGLASMLIVILGAIALLVGLLVAIPVVSAASAAFYNRVLAANPPSQLGAPTFDSFESTDLV